MLKNNNIFFNKKILIYGLGKSGLSAYQYLKKNNTLYLFDDKKISLQNIEIRKRLIKYNNINNNKFDRIIISPGIDLNKCKLSKYLKKNLYKINTDLDIFYCFYPVNKNITITGTNGKSTTVKILYNLLKDQKFDVRLVGNIGNPILLEKNITKKTFFVIEASSYQLEYSKLFRADFSAILNISPDHLERHGKLKNYIRAKFKLVRNQTKKGMAFLNTKNPYINKELKKKKIFCKVVKIKKNISLKNLEKINNPYFISKGNIENLSFAFAIAKKLNLKKNILYKTLSEFTGLKYRQQIIHKSKNLTIINDSKATSYSSSLNILKSLSNVRWLVGGIAKKGDKFLLSKKQCLNFKAYIFGKHSKHFVKELKNKVNLEYFDTLKKALRKVFIDIDLKNKKNINQTILFSPSAASFDSFKNFEERGKKFNTLIKKIIDAR
ncbi:UDP-N-acetylmuramoyl-L-alanine--D-glutamate ligase [Candidatus Pelagibacter sp.]|nr:UDP-N-acetylmuramoyl-L-alanine--D-glutamate ligase [Candidatus Pelagibacter sp.]